MAGQKVAQDTGDLVLNRVSKFYGDFCAVDETSKRNHENREKKEQKKKEK